MKIVKKFMFDYEPEKKSLFLVDLSGARSGQLMKSLDFLQPDVYKEFKEELDKKDYKIGDYIVIRDRYVFFIVRKHYRTGFKHEDFIKVAPNLPYDWDYKITNEDKKLEPYLLIMLEIYDRIEVYKTSVWEERNKI